MVIPRTGGASGPQQDPQPTDAPDPVFQVPICPLDRFAVVVYQHLGYGEDFVQSHVCYKHFGSLLIEGKKLFDNLRQWLTTEAPG